MKKGIFIICLFAAFAGCKTRQDKFKPMADLIKQRFMTMMPDIYKIDTLFLFVDTITPKKLLLMNADEQKMALEVMRITGAPPTFSQVDSTISPDYDTFFIAKNLEYTYDSLISLAKKTDSSTLLYYNAHPFIYYKTKNMEQHQTEDELLFDKGFNLIPMNSVINKNPVDYTLTLKEQPYTPIQDSIRNKLIKSGMLVYF